MENIVNNIRRMQPGDVDAVVQVHMDTFQGFFLTFLGPAFLREFYKGVCEDSSGIALVYDEDSVLGFVAGSVQPSGFYKHLIRKHWWKFGLASLRPVAMKPFIVPRLLRALTLPGKTDDSQTKMGMLMSLAVKQDDQGKGVGRQLVLSFLLHSRERGVESINLTTDAFGNDRINKFYLKMGFRCVKTFSTPEGRLMNEYLLVLSSVSFDLLQ
jgi:ribosomal protein S18 acetylase RimI-like enzyme